MWCYRPCRKTNKLGKRKVTYYCVVEFYPRVPIYNRRNKVLRYKDLWSYDPEAPIGSSVDELIKTIEMMLVDVKRYRKRVVIDD